MKEELMQTASKFLISFMEDKGSASIDSGYNLLINEIMELTFSLINALGCVYSSIMLPQLKRGENALYEILKAGKNRHNV